MNEGKTPKQGSSSENHALFTFNRLTKVLEKIEGEETIDLNRPIDNYDPDNLGALNQKEELKQEVDLLKIDMDFLDQKLKKQAEGMIIRAELYLAAH